MANLRAVIETMWKYMWSVEVVSGLWLPCVPFVCLLHRDTLGHSRCHTEWRSPNARQSVCTATVIQRCYPAAFLLNVMLLQRPLDCDQTSILHLVLVNFFCVVHFQQYFPMAATMVRSPRLLYKLASSQIKCLSIKSPTNPLW